LIAKLFDVRILIQVLIIELMKHKSSMIEDSEEILEVVEVRVRLETHHE